MSIPSLSANALINLQTLVDYYGTTDLKKIKHTAESWSDVSGSYIPLINHASEAFHNDVLFNLFSGSLQNEWFEGDNSSEYYVKYSVAGMSDVYVYDIYYLEGPKPTDLVCVSSGSYAYEWTYYPNEGRIVITDGNYFHTNIPEIDNWRIRYHYGIQGPVPSGSRIPTTQVPYDIQAAVCEEVIRLRTLREQKLHTQETTGTGGTTTVNLNFKSEEYWTTVNKYRRYV